jgi:hypothetical protein
MRPLSTIIKNRLNCGREMLKVENKNLRAALFFLIFISLTALNYISDWWVFKVSGSSEVKIRESSDFADLIWIKSFVGCYRKVENSLYLYDDASPCHLGYFYGSTLIKIFEIAKIDSLSVFWIGSTLTVLFCISLGVFASKLENKKIIYVTFIIFSLFSPGIWLLLERANLDILIFLMLLVGSQLFSRGNEISGILVIALSALFKFYTLPAILILLIITNRRLTRIVGILVGLLVTYIVFLDITSITNPGFPSTWYISFGIESIGLYLNLMLEHFTQTRFQFSNFGVKILGYFFFLISCIYFNKKHQTTLHTLSHILLVSKNNKELNYLQNIYWISGTTFISCYLAGMSYDYRLLFLAVSGLSLMALKHANGVSIKKLYLLILISLWFSGSFLPATSLIFSGTIQLIGDVAIFLLATFFTLISIYSIKLKISN